MIVLTILIILIAAGWILIERTLRQGADAANRELRQKREILRAEVDELQRRLKNRMETIEQQAARIDELEEKAVEQTLVSRREVAAKDEALGDFIQKVEDLKAKNSRANEALMSSESQLKLAREDVLSQRRLREAEFKNHALVREAYRRKKQQWINLEKELEGEIIELKSKLRKRKTSAKKPATRKVKRG
jgi:coenzyme F420-reducing hydrogenase delta subunit